MQFGVSYFGVRNPQHFQRDLEDIARLGFTSIIFTFSEEDHRFYQGSLTEFVRRTHQQGLKAFVDPWGVCGVFGGEAFSERGHGISKGNNVAAMGGLWSPLALADPYDIADIAPRRSSVQRSCRSASVITKRGSRAFVWAGQAHLLGEEMRLMASAVLTISLSSYLATGYMSSHTCVDAPRVWEVFTQTMQALR